MWNRPLGYLAGPGITPEVAEKFNAAQNDSATKIEKAFARIENALKEGGKQMDSLKKDFNKVFGKGSATKENIQKVLNVARKMDTALRDNGSKGFTALGMPGSYFKERWNYDPEKVLAAGEVGGQTIFINMDHRLHNNLGALRWGIRHESSHNAGIAHDYAYKHESSEYKDQSTEKRMDNADNYTDFLR